jgi:signal transduction histidine kinase
MGRIGRAFLIQAVFIALTAVAGVILARVMIIDLLNTEALQMEATHYWQRWKADRSVPPPATRNLTTYIAPTADLSAVPGDLRSLPPGLHHRADATGTKLIFVSDDRAHRLFMILDSSNIDSLAYYFGLVPLTVALMVLYFSAWLVYRVMSRAISPVMRLAQAVREIDIERPDAGRFTLPDSYANLDEEVVVLTQALQQMTERINRFVERERNFTRDASHELRSPLTVIRLASDSVARRADLPAGERTAIERIQRAVREMEETTEAFLLLARESDQGLVRKRVLVNDIVREEIERAGWLKPEHVTISLEEAARIEVDSPPRVLAAMVGNLLRNAVTHSRGANVRVAVGGREIRIADDGPGLPAGTLQDLLQASARVDDLAAEVHGVGLAIVRRLSERFGWPISIDSPEGNGTVITIRFPETSPSPAAG